jgi:hypothetical protein
MLRVLSVLLVLGLAAPALAQAPARKPRTLSGVCGKANWVCVAECIDTACVDQCLQKGCEEALARLDRCTHSSGCGPDDSECSARQCGAICQKTFEPAPPSPVKEKPEPCEGVSGAKVPEELVGDWVLSAATLKPGVRRDPEVDVPDPRSDYQRTLRVTANGCFVTQMQLEDDTLGRGNALVVRSWGTFEMKDKDVAVLRTQDGQAVGTVCGKPRVTSLAKGRFGTPSYTFDVDGDTLTLTAQTASKQTLQFQRAKKDAGETPSESQ